MQSLSLLTFITRKASLPQLAARTAMLLASLAALAGMATARAATTFTEKETWVNNGNRRIYGITATPEGHAGRRPVAIIAHGFNGNHSSGRAYFATLCAMGYKCYAFDFPCGSARNRSDANTMNMSVADEAADLSAIVAHMRTLPDVDTTGIVIIGESQGGLAAVMAAAGLKGQLSRLVLVYPALCIPDNWNKAYKSEADIPDTTRVWGVPLGRRFFKEARAIDVGAAMAGYDGPVLIVHGDKDNVVPLEYSRRAANAYADASLHVVFGAGHGFDKKQQAEAMGRIKTFLTPPDSAFDCPPQEARPLMIWQWMDGIVTAEGITADLEAYRSAGIGGVQQFMVGGPMQVAARDTANAIGTDNWRRLMRHAISECRRLGLTFGTHNCPGWSSSAYPTVTPEYSMQKLVWTDTVVTIGRHAGPIELRRPATDPRYDFYRDIAVLAMPADTIAGPADVIDISATFDAATSLARPELAKGTWRLMRFGHTTNGKTNEATAPYGGLGLECDKMSREAVRRYWESYPEMLLDIAGDDAGQTFCRLEIDSYEAGGQDWTPLMPGEFKARTGYDLLPWLPVMAGHNVGGAEQSKRFYTDFKKVVMTLFAENYYGYMAELAHQSGGIRLLYQPYGTGGAKPFSPISTEAITSQLPDDCFCTEFWLKPENWGWPSVPRHTAVAHANGLRRVYAEGFTAWAPAAWRESPEDMKRMADRAFCLGVNALMIHAGAQNPWPGAVPGMTFGRWGAWCTPGQTWWRSGAARLLFDYLARCQALLQRGRHADDYRSRQPSLRADAGSLQWTHRRDGATDIYFIANTLDSAFSATISIASAGRTPEIWHPDTGIRHTAMAWSDNGSGTTVKIDFDEHEALFIVLRRTATAQAPGVKPQGRHEADTLAVGGGWTLRFAEGWGAPAEVRLDSLMPWNEHPDAGVRYFSGSATYTKTVDIGRKDRRARYVLCLGDVKHTARVSVNGRECAHLWKKPYRCDITDFIDGGDNEVEIEVTNLWPNRMIGDEQLPDDMEWSEPIRYSYAPGNPVIGRQMKSVPEWLAKGLPRPQQGRKAVVSFKFFEKDEPLLPSGLLGPVTIVVER